MKGSSSRNLRGEAWDGLSANRCFLWSASGCVHTFVLTLSMRTSRLGPLPLIVSTTEYREVRYLLEKTTGGKPKRIEEDASVWNRSVHQKSRRCEDRQGAKRKETRKRTEGERAGIFIQKIAALNPRRALLLNFTFLVRKRGPFHSASKKSIMPCVRIALGIIRRNTSSRDTKWYNS